MKVSYNEDLANHIDLDSCAAQNGEGTAQSETPHVSTHLEREPGDPAVGVVF